MRRCVIRDFRGLSAAQVPSSVAELDDYLPVLRSDIAHLDYFLRDLSRGMGLITKGLVPDGSGTPIADVTLSDIYWVLGGRSGNQEGFGGRSPSGTATIGSTSNATKGFVYLGSSSGVAFDETNAYVGIATAAPSARLHITVPDSLSDFARPTSDTTATGNWAATGAPTRKECLDDVDDDADGTDYCRFDEVSGGATLTVFFDNLTTITDPGIDTGFKVRFTLRAVSTYNARMALTMSPHPSGTSFFSNKKYGGPADVQAGNEANVTTSFVQYTYTLSDSESASVDFTKQ